MSVRIYGRLSRTTGFSWPLHVPWYLIAVLIASFCPTRHAHGQQVEPTVTLRGGAITTVMHNTSTEPMTVTVGLYRPRPGGVLPDTTAPVAALIAPDGFLLGAGEQQLVRIRLRGPASGPLRLMSCWLPVIRRASARVTIRTRLCLNAAVKAAP